MANLYIWWLTEDEIRSIARLDMFNADHTNKINDVIHWPKYIKDEFKKLVDQPGRHALLVNKKFSWAGPIMGGQEGLSGIVIEPQDHSHATITGMVTDLNYRKIYWE